MSGFLDKITTAYVEAAKRSVRYVRPKLELIFVTTAISALSFYVFDLAFNPTFDTFWFRIVGTSTCLIPIYLIRTKAAEQTIVWSSIGAATVVLMWMFPAMLIVNAATLEPGDTLNYSWICMYLISIFLYVQFISNFLTAFTGWALGFSAASACLLMVDNPNMDSVLVNCFYPFSIYLTAIVFGNLVNQHVESVERDKTEAAKAIGGNIAHELRTPLSGISSRAKALEKLLPEFASVYQLAVDKGLVSNPLRKNQIEVFRQSATDIQEEANFSNTVISMLLINTAEDRFKDVEFDVFRACDVIEEAIGRYPFPNSKEREMVKVVGDTCKDVIQAPKLLVEHILFNLFKNALFYCQEAGKGDIEVSASSVEAGIRLVVRDTGPGIAQNVLPKIFDRFFTTSPMGRGSGIGLNFCKNVMNDLGGSIECISKIGEFTEFTVEFPREGK